MDVLAAETLLVDLYLLVDVVDNECGDLIILCVLGANIPLYNEKVLLYIIDIGVSHSRFLFRR